MDAYRNVFTYMLIGLVAGGLLAAVAPYVLLLNAYTGGGAQDWQFEVLDRDRDIKIARAQANNALLARTIIGAGICSLTGALIAAVETDNEGLQNKIQTDLLEQLRTES